MTSKVVGGIRNTGDGITTISDLLLSTLPTNGDGAPLFYVCVAAPVPRVRRLAKVPQELR